MADCKYKRSGPDRPVNTDYYQVLAYCTAAGVSRGLLLYPKHELLAEDELAVAHSEVRISRLNIDLDKDWKLLGDECRVFAGKVFRSLTGS